MGLPRKVGKAVTKVAKKGAKAGKAGVKTMAKMAASDMKKLPYGH